MTSQLREPSLIPPEAIHAAIMLGRYFFAGCLVLAIVPQVIRLLAKPWERSPVSASVASSDTTARLARIEQAVEAVAIEVERIAEAQRFSARLMAEESKQSVPRASPGQ